MTTVSAGTSKTFTAQSTGMSFVVSTPGGAVGSVVDQNGVTNLINSTGMRRTFGPLGQGQTITVNMQLGNAVVDLLDWDGGAPVTKVTNSTTGLDELPSSDKTALGNSKVAFQYNAQPTLSSLKRTLAASTAIQHETRIYKLKPPNWASGDYFDSNVVIDTNDGRMYYAHGALTTANSAQSTVAPSLTTAAVWYSANKPAGAFLQPTLAQGSWSAPNNWTAPSTYPSGVTSTVGWVDIGTGAAGRFDNTTDPVTYVASSTSPGGTDVATAQNNLMFYGQRLDAGAVTVASGGTFNNIAGQKNGAANNLTGLASIEFDTDQAWVGWRQASAPQEMAVFVDGQQVTPGAVQFDGATYSNFNPVTNLYRKLTFTGTSKVRRVRLQSLGGNTVTNLYAPNASGVHLELVHNTANNWLFVGDSYTENPQAAGLWAHSLGSYVADELGLPMPVQSAIGGTGFVKNSNDNTAPAYFDRLMFNRDAHKAKNYIMSVLMCTGNDVGYLASTTTVYQKVYRTLQLLRYIQGPGSPIFIAGAASSDLTNSSYATFASYLTTVKQAVSDFFAIDGAVYYLPMSSADRTGGALFPYTSSYWYIGNTNNHPFDNAQLLYAREIATQIRALANAAQ